jgi:hypothetical protein
MHRSKFLTALCAVGAIVGAAPASGATAQSDAPTTVSKVEITGAYAYRTSILGDGKTYASVVFKTADQLPRRFDGMLRASAALDGTGHSIASVRGRHGKAANCYTALFRIMDGKIAGPKGKKASIGSKHAFKLTARGTNGDIGDTAAVTLRRQKAGDVSGRPLGC